MTELDNLKTCQGELEHELSILQARKMALQCQLSDETGKKVEHYADFIAQYIECRKLYADAEQVFQEKHEIDRRLHTLLANYEIDALNEQAKTDLSLQNLRRLFDQKGSLETAKVIQKYCHLNCPNLIKESKQFLHQTVANHVGTLFTWTMNECQFMATVSQSFSLVFKEIFDNCLTDWKYEDLFKGMLNDLATFVATWPNFSATYQGSELVLKKTEDITNAKTNNSLAQVEEFCKAIGINGLSFIENLSAILFAPNEQFDFLLECKHILSKPSECIKLYQCKIQTDSPGSSIFVRLLNEHEFLVRDVFVDYADALDMYLNSTQTGILDEKLKTVITSTCFAFPGKPIDLESACYYFNEAQCFIQLLSSVENPPQFLVAFLVEFVQKAINAVKEFLPSIDRFDSILSVVECHELLSIWIKGPSACMITAELLSCLYETFILVIFTQQFQRKEMAKFSGTFLDFLQRFPDLVPFLQSELAPGMMNEIHRVIQTNQKEIHPTGVEFKFLSKAQISNIHRNGTL